MFYPEIKSDINYDPENLRWNGWGAEGHDWFYADRVPHVREFFEQELGGGAALPDTPSVRLEDLKVPKSRLSEKDVTALQGIAGKNGATSELRMRVLHSVGQSYYDVVRLCTNELKDFTDAVVFPANEAQIKKIFDWCVKNKVALVPYGGGSSVVGGVEALKRGGQKAVLTVNLTRMNSLLELDEYSRQAVFEPGIFGPQLEQELGERGYTLGHFPQSFEYSTLGGWVAARSGGQQSNRYGKIEEIISSVRVLTPAGTIETLNVPADGAGPDINQVVAGSEGLLGIITRVTVKVHRLPEGRRYSGIMFPSFEKALDFQRECSTHDFGLSMVRLSDGEETRLFSILAQVTKKPAAFSGIKHQLQEGVLRLMGQREGRCIVVAGLDGEEERMGREEINLRRIIRKHGGFYAGRSVGERWLRGRFNMPFLRNHIMNFGVGVDTLETATTYAKAKELHSAVIEALKSVSADTIAFCHLSHSYHDGACLYFTFMFRLDVKDPVGQWKKYKTAASDAIAKLGATISHHHGVGADHAPWYAKLTGKLAVAGLRAFKKEADPQGILNPGKLFD